MIGKKQERFFWELTNLQLYIFADYLIYLKLNDIIQSMIGTLKGVLNMKKSAQSLIEYGLILALVAIVAVTILGKFSKSINTVGEQANTAVSSAGTNAMGSYCTSIGSTYNATSGKCE